MAALTKDELISAVRSECRLIVHLAEKAAGDLDYRPAAAQRSSGELLGYLAIMPPIHLRAALSDEFDMDAWRREWTAGESRAQTMSATEAVAEIGRYPALFEQALADVDLRRNITLFGNTASRGAMLVSLVLTHLAAYRMQLFLYAKASAHPELNTWNLWVGRDPAPRG